MNHNGNFAAGIKTNSADIQFFDRNSQGRDFVVGDLHGCTDEFWAELEKAKFNSDVDRVFSVGDLIDRGPDSVGALKLLENSWFHAVMGNHELLMIKALFERNKEALAAWFRNGGMWWLNLTVEEANYLCQLVSALPMAIVVGDGDERFNIVHAEFPGVDVELDAAHWCDRTRQQMLWSRSLSKINAPSIRQGLSPTYCGHTLVQAISKKESHIFLDTGIWVKYVDNDPWDSRLTLVQANCLFK